MNIGSGTKDVLGGGMGNSGDGAVYTRGGSFSTGGVGGASPWRRSSHGKGSAVMWGIRRKEKRALLLCMANCGNMDTSTLLPRTFE